MGRVILPAPILGDTMEHVLGTAPEKVTIVGCGPTVHDYCSVMLSKQASQFQTDEVWAINRAGGAIVADLTFVMDDYLYCQSQGAGGCFDDCKTPIITSAPRRDGDHAFPLSEVFSIPGARDYLNHTAAYMVAYAILIGVKEICLFGCDYISAAKQYGSAGSDLPSRYMACLAFWLGIAAARGISVVPTPNTPLLDSDTPPENKFYGYLVPPVVKREGE